MLSSFESFRNAGNVSCLLILVQFPWSRCLHVLLAALNAVSCAHLEKLFSSCPTDPEYSVGSKEVMRSAEMSSIADPTV